MGAHAGEYLAQRHPAGSEPVKVAWFPGPRGAGWVNFVEEGFRKAIADSAVRVVVTKWGDTGKEIQLLLIEDVLEERPDIDYMVGSAVTAEAAIRILRARGLSDQIQIVADYFTHAVYRGIKRGRVLAAPTDFPVLQGRLAIDQAIRVLEGKLMVPHAGPAIRMMTPETVNVIGPDESLNPAWFLPRFTVE
jgi:protein TorT